MEEVLGFVGRWGFAALLVALASSALGRWLASGRSARRLWRWSERIAWSLLGLGLLACVVGLLGLLGQPSSSYLMALGTALGFVGLFWLVWW